MTHKLPLTSANGVLAAQLPRDQEVRAAKVFG